MAKTVTLLKAGNRMAVTPPDDGVYGLLEPILRYTSKRILYGEERYEAQSNVELQDWDLFIYDVKKRLVCPFGFYHRVRETLSEHGYRVKIRDLRPHPNPRIFDPDWDRVLRWAKLRYGQDQFIIKAASHPCGRFSCPPGYGKSFLIALMSQAFPKARIDVTTADASVTRRLYNELIGLMPNVGCKGAGKSITGKRVQLYCAASLHHSDFQADILLADEVHQLGADRYAESLARYQSSRMFGMSATHDMRLDNKDIRLEGVFGPIIFELGYQECVDQGLIVPIKVIWRPVVMDRDPAEGEKDTARVRAGIWQNKYRNEMIAHDVCQLLNRADKEEQILVAVRTVEHLVHLKKEFRKKGVNIPLVYAEGGLPSDDRRKYIKWGLIDNDEPDMSLNLRKQYEDDFKAGKIRIAACNSVWDTGMDFPKLTVLARGDALASQTLDTQIPGRTSRLDDGKQYGLVLDYMDQFNQYFRDKALDRQKGYKRNGWDQIYPQRPRSRLRQTVLFS